MNNKFKKFVVHCKRSEYDVYIGRPGKWGNPFMIDEDHNRDDVIQMYKEWLNGEREISLITAKSMGNDFRLNPPTIEEIQKELKGKILGCWCSPRKCHGDILAEIANSNDLIKY